MPRVLVVDDSDIFRRGLRAILRMSTGWEVCGEAENAEEGARFAEELKPDAVLMDVSMPGIGGLEAIRLIQPRVHGAKIVVLSLHESWQLAETMLEAGARGYVVKTRADSDLIDALNAVMRSETYVSPGLAGALEARA